MPRLQERTIHGRQVTLWLPDGSLTGRPLLLCHDGQNLFTGEHTWNGQSWRLDAALLELERDGMSVPVVVAPWCRRGFHRWLDYAPEDVLRSDEEIMQGFLSWPSASGHTPDQFCGNAYATWCAESLVPDVRAEFSLSDSRNDTAIMGSSMGGLASLYALSRFPDVFGAVLSLSTHWTPGGPRFPRACVDLLPPAGSHRIWLDHGDLGLDAEYGPFQAIADARLAELGWRHGVDLMSRVYPGTDHNEDAWAGRVADVLRFWLVGR